MTISHNFRISNCGEQHSTNKICAVKIIADYHLYNYYFYSFIHPNLSFIIIVAIGFVLIRVDVVEMSEIRKFRSTNRFCLYLNCIQLAWTHENLKAKNKRELRYL